MVDNLKLIRKVILIKSLVKSDFTCLYIIFIFSLTFVWIDNMFIFHQKLLSCANRPLKSVINDYRRFVAVNAVQFRGYSLHLLLQSRWHFNLFVSIVELQGWFLLLLKSCTLDSEVIIFIGSSRLLLCFIIGLKYRYASFSSLVLELRLLHNFELVLIYFPIIRIKISAIYL